MHGGKWKYRIGCFSGLFHYPNVAMFFKHINQFWPFYFLYCNYIPSNYVWIKYEIIHKNLVIPLSPISKKALRKWSTYLCYLFTWICIFLLHAAEQLCWFSGLQKRGDQEAWNESEHLLVQSWSLCGQFNRVEGAEYHQPAWVLDGAQCQVSLCSTVLCYWKPQNSFKKR